MPDTAESFLADLDNPKPKGPDTAESFLADLDRATPDQAASVRAAIFGSEDPNAQPAPTEMVDLLLETRGHNARVESEAAKYGKELDREAFPGIFKAAPSEQALAFERMGGAEGYRKAERALALERMGGTPTVGQVVSEVNAAKQDARLAEDASALRREEAPWLIRHGARFAVGALEQAQAAGEYVRENLIRPAAPDIAEAMRGLGGRYGMTPEGTDAIRRDTPGVPGAIAEMAGQTAAFVPQVALGGVPGAAAVSTAAAGGDAMAGLETAVFLKTAGGLTRLFGGASQSVIRQVLAEGGAMTAAGVATRMGFHGDPGTLHQAGVDALTGLAFGIMGGSARAKEAAKQYRAALESGKTLDAAAIEAGIPPEKIRNIDLDAAMAEGQRQREAAKASVTPVEAPLERPPQSDVVARPAPEPTAPEKPVSVAPVAPDTASKMYHGSPRTDLRVVQSNPQSRQYDNATSQFGAFFSPSESEASRYAGKSGRVYSADVQLSRPYEMSWAEFNKFQSPDKGPDGKTIPDFSEAGLARRTEELKSEAAKLRRDLESQGYDGVIVRSGRGSVLEIASFKDVPLSDTNPPAPVAPDAPASKTLVGTDKRGRKVWEVRGKFYVRDTGGRLGTAHPQEVAEAKASAQSPAPETGLSLDVGPSDRPMSQSFKAWQSVFQETLSKTGDVNASFKEAESRHPGDYRPAMTDSAARAMLAEKNAKTDAMVDGMVEMARRVGNEKDASYWEGQREVYREKNRQDVESKIRDQESDATLARDLRRLEATHGYLSQELPKAKAQMQGAVENFGDALREHSQRQGLPALIEPQVEARPMEAGPAEAPVPRPGKQAERGALSLAPVGEFLGEVASGAKRVFGETISRVRAYKTPAAEETARKATEAVDAAKAYRGEMGRELLAAEKLTGQPVVTRLGRAATRLSTPTPVPNARFTEPTLYDAIEGRRAPASPEEARIVDTLRRVIWKSGEVTERAGLMQRDAQGNYAPFVNRTDKIAPRITTTDFHEIVQKGKASAGWQPMIDAFDKLNPSIGRQRIEAHFDEMHKEMVQEGPQAEGARAQAEFTRSIPRVPATIEAGGRTLRLFETNPATYIRRLVETRAQRLGFVDAFGQDVPGQATPVKDLRERFAKETGKPQEFVNLTRELHGHAKDVPIVDPASITGGLLRNADRAWSVVREGLLSASAIVNVPEPIGATQSLVGTRRLAKAIYVAFRGKSHPMNAAVDALGATTRDHINASYDPANPRGSVARMMTEMLSRTFGRKFVEEFQERVAAVGGKMMADDMQAGKGSGYDIHSLKTMGWSDADARRLAKGGGTQAEYDAISRRLPTVAVGANQSKAEKSWFQNTRVLRPLNAIAAYAHTAIRNAASAHKAFVDTMGRVVDGTGLTPKERWAGTFRAFQHLTGFYVAKTLQGAAATMLAAAVGRSLGIKKSEAEDEPFDFAAKSFISSTFGGPYAATARAMFGDGNLSQISPQVSVALEAIDALNGNGKYRDLPLSERMAQLATRFLPVSRVMRSMAVAVGLGNEQSQDIENARSAYWSWRKKFDKTTFTGKEAETDAEQAYRTALKSAYLAMTRGGEPEEVAKRVLSAIGGEDAIGKDKKKAAESIRRRMLLTAPAVKGKLDALKSRIGADAYKTLETHDALLESLADSVQRGG